MNEFVPTEHLRWAWGPAEVGQRAGLILQQWWVKASTPLYQRDSIGLWRDVPTALVIPMPDGTFSDAPSATRLLDALQPEASPP